MRHRWLWGVALSLGFVSGLAVGTATAPPAVGAALRELEPGLWRAEVGDFTELVAAVAFDADDIWAAGDGIVHFDGAGWRQTLPGKRPFFQAIDGLSSQQLWAAGAIEVTYCDRYGVMYRYDGVAWRAETVETHVPLYDVDMVSATDGWAVGGVENAVIVRYDGTAWRAQVAPEVAGLRAVHAVATDDVWAVGNRGAMAHFDGRDWTAVDGPRFANLTDVHFLDQDFGVAVGVDTSTPTGVVLVYRGGEWSLDSLEELPQLYSVQVLAPAVIVAVGGNGAILFNDGRSWREVGRTHPGGYHAYGWGPALHSLVVLPDRETMIAVGYAGQVVRIEDTLAWTELHTGHRAVGHRHAGRRLRLDRGLRRAAAAVGRDGLDGPGVPRQRPLAAGRGRGGPGRRVGGGAAGDGAPLGWRHLDGTATLHLAGPAGSGLHRTQRRLGRRQRLRE